MGTAAAAGGEERLGCQAKDADGSFWLGTDEADNHGRSLESLCILYFFESDEWGTLATPSNLSSTGNWGCLVTRHVKTHRDFWFSSHRNSTTIAVNSMKKKINLL